MHNLSKKDSFQEDLMSYDSVIVCNWHGPRALHGRMLVYRVQLSHWQGTIGTEECLTKY